MGLYEKRYINSSIPLNKIIVYTTTAHIENNSPMNQSLTTTGFTKSIERITEITFSRTFGFSIGADIEIKIPIKYLEIKFDVHFEANFSEHQSVTKRVTENETITAPPQTINVGAFSRVNVTYDVYKYVATLNNYLHFEVTPHAKDLFAFFLKKMGNAVYGQGDLKLECLNGIVILRNFPETEKLPSLGIDVTIGPEEKIPNLYRKNKNFYIFFLIIFLFLFIFYFKMTNKNAFPSNPSGFAKK